MKKIVFSLVNLVHYDHVTFTSSQKYNEVNASFSHNRQVITSTHNAIDDESKFKLAQSTHAMIFSNCSY